MSDLFEAREKTEKGAEWRGSIHVDIDGETHELTVRQLVDPEFWEVMTYVDTDELEALQSDLPEETMEEFQELQEQDSLSDEEEDRLEELTQEVESQDIDIFEALSYETYKGLKLAAEYGIEPDQSDIQKALTQHTDEVEDQYGSKTQDAAKEYVNDHVVKPMLDNSTDFTSFAIGVRALGETLGDQGN
jgi:hypothetical protein